MRQNSTVYSTIKICIPISIMESLPSDQIATDYCLNSGMFLVQFIENLKNFES